MPSTPSASPQPPAAGLSRRSLLRIGAGALAVGTAGSAFGATPSSATPGLGRGDRSALVREVAAAAAEHGIPAGLLLAAAWVNTRGRMPSPGESAYRSGDPGARGAYGPAALVRNPFTDTVGEAVRLTGISAHDLMTNRAANLSGGAALLAESLPRSHRRARRSGLESLAAVEDLHPAYAGQLRQALSTRAWQRPPQTVHSGAVLTRSGLSASATKPPVEWYPAHPDNYTAANRPSSHPITTIVVHVTQGSWAGTLSWFQDPAAGVSAHYTVRSSDGRIGQSVSDLNIGYHAGNWSVNQTSIGIEHEGYVDDPSWFTPELFDGSARLTAYLCGRYGIPIDRTHIIGHNEVPGADHTDPGPWWWWSYYMDRVRSYA